MLISGESGETPALARRRAGGPDNDASASDRVATSDNLPTAIEVIGGGAPAAATTDRRRRRRRCGRGESLPPTVGTSGRLSGDKLAVASDSIASFGGEGVNSLVGVTADTSCRSTSRSTS